MTFFQDAYVGGTALWETGRPQPEVVALAKAGKIGGLVLDAGCGTGENAIHLARCGLTVIGVDLALRAIQIARCKAAARVQSVEFAVCDVRSLPFPRKAFDTVLDSGLFHVFDEIGKAKYEQCLRAVVRPGGLVHVIVWSEEQPGEEGPVRVTQAELRSSFARGWEDLNVRAGVYETAIHEQGARAWVATFRKSDL